MANKHPWFAFYGDDYERDTCDLSLLEHGAYLKLMIHYYKTGEPLPNDPTTLQRICRAHSDEELQAISRVISKFFIQKNGNFHNYRCDAELKEARRISRIRRNARLGKRKTNDNHKSPDLCLQSQSQSHTQKKESKPKAASAFEVPNWIPQKDWQDFEEMRRKLRKPMTDRARALIVGELLKLKQQGHEPSAVLAQSIKNSWQDVYEPRGEHGTNRQVTQPTRQPSAQVARFHNNRTELERAFGAAAVGGSSDANGAGQAARLGTGDTPLLEGEVKKIH